MADEARMRHSLQDAPAPPADRRVERVGAIHVHSTFSDGDEPVGRIVAAAAATGLDYVLLTDHDTLEARRRGMSGYHGDVLLAVGAEITCARGEHFLALGAEPVDDLYQGDPTTNTRIIRRRGGRIILAHVGGSHRRDLPGKARAWQSWQGADFDALELWSFMHDWVHGLGLFQMPFAYFRPFEWIAGPPPRAMAKWDELTRTRRVGLVGGLDNHARRMPLLGRMPLIGRICVFGHERLFRAFAHHAFVPPPTGRAEADTNALFDALAVGRGFVCLTHAGDGRGTRLIAQTPAGNLGMGDEQPFGPPTRLHLRLPAAGQVRLIRNGHTVLERDADGFDEPLDAPGVYRVEADRHRLPWIRTNPIYLRP
jgi:hypothetical protein